MKVLDVYGTKISIISFDQLVSTILNYTLKPTYICFTDVLVLKESFDNAVLRNALNSSYINIPDGKAISLYCKFRGIKNINTISGYWLLLELLKSNKKHFFYGTNAVKHLKIKKFISENFQDANILGFKEPPHIDFNNIIDNDRIKNDFIEISQFGPDIIWVGVGGVKQDVLMNEYHKYLDHGIMIGIGAVFDYISGDQRKSPEWIKKIYLRWLYRLIFNPNLKRTKRVISAIFIFIKKLVRYR